MAKAKQYVFSARTTEGGLKQLSDLKAKLNVGWDEMVIEAISAHYSLDKAELSLPKKEALKKEQPPVKDEQEPVREPLKGENGAVSKKKGTKGKGQKAK